MKKAIYAKLSQDDKLRKTILETGDKEIAEANPSDLYWELESLSGLREALVFATECKNNVDPRLRSHKKVNYIPAVFCTYNSRV